MTMMSLMVTLRTGHYMLMRIPQLEASPSYDFSDLIICYLLDSYGHVASSNAYNHPHTFKSASTGGWTGPRGLLLN